MEAAALNRPFGGVEQLPPGLIQDARGGHKGRTWDTSKTMKSLAGLLVITRTPFATRRPNLTAAARRHRRGHLYHSNFLLVSGLRCGEQGVFQTTAHEARGPLIITRGRTGVLSDRPMGGLTAGGGVRRL